jgi:hypothetical protein
MFMIALVTLSIMLFAKDPKVVHAYVLASALTDFPHWASFFYVLGWEGVKEWRTWESPLWMQLGVPVFTFGFKVGYLMGWLGEDRAVDREEMKKGLWGDGGWWMVEDGIDLPWLSAW